MNKYLVALCTPDAFRPSAKAAIAALKKTNLSSTDLIVLDNGYEQGFRHAEAMNAVLDYARDQWVFFLDDDVLIAQRDWLQQLVSDAETADATLIGCIHTFASGEVNHSGAIAHDDGSTELRRSPLEALTYMPALSSAALGITPGNDLRFDTCFEKYQHDLDLCLETWRRGYKVAISPRVTVVHTMADYFSTLSPPAVAYQHDAALFREKWQAYCADGLYRIPQLKKFATVAAEPNWESRYNQASALRSTDPASASNKFRVFIDHCPHAHLLAGAHFHLFGLHGQVEHLHECLALNPLHQKARQLLDEVGHASVLAVQE